MSSVIFKAALPISLLCGCGGAEKIVGYERQGAVMSERSTEDIESQQFGDISSLLEAFHARALKFTLYDREGLSLTSEKIISLCANHEQRRSASLVVDDDNKRVLKRYKIECLAGGRVNLKKDFGYKNPYQ